LRKIIVRAAQSLIAVHHIHHTALPLLRKIIVRAAQSLIAVHIFITPHYLCCEKSSSERRNPRLQCTYSSKPTSHYPLLRKIIVGAAKS